MRETDDHPSHVAQADAPDLAAALQAAAEVGRLLGVEIKGPRRAERASVAARIDSFEAIAHASHLRIRPVRLRAGWHEQDCGPLLGYLRGGHVAVALLPLGRSSYEYLDPATQTRKPVTAQVTDLFEAQAFMVYPSFAPGPVRLWDLFAFGFAASCRDLVGVGLLGLLVALLGLIFLQAIGMIVDQAIPVADRSLLGQIGLGLLVLAGGVALAEVARNILTVRAETAADHALQSAVWDRLLRLRLTFFRGYSAGDILARVSTISRIRRILSGATVRTILSSAFGLLYIGVLVAISPSLAGIALAVAALVAAATALAWLANFRRAGEMMQVAGWLGGLVVHLIQLVPKLRVAAAEDRAFAFWGQGYARELKLRLRIDRVDDILGVANDAIVLGATMALFAVAITPPPATPAAATTAAISTGAFLAFLVTYRAFLDSARDLSGALVRLLPAANLWRRVRPILEAEPEVSAARVDPGPLQGQVHVEGLSFRYRAGGPLVLRDLSFRAEPGEFVALVGRSGSGKTTLLRLLLGFDSPEVGRVLYDGKNLADLDVYALRRQLGVVIQDARVFQGSIYDNIAAGAAIRMDEAEDAADLAGLTDDLAGMPMGMHTLVSDGGGNLSGGQRQRLLIARALVRQPRILLLDEATSALDNRSQDVIIDSLRSRKATRIVIAHRLHTIRHADRIYVLEDGAIVQHGTFDELVNQPGMFARLIARQEV